MANKLLVLNQLRPKIISQGVVNLEELSDRVSRNTTYNKEEIYSVLRLFVDGVTEALQNGETVKINRLVNISPNMKVGGKVNMSLRVDRAALAALNNPVLWGAGKVTNYAHLNKSSAQLIEIWDQQHPDDVVTE
jgi:hypothetical protein